MNRPTLYLMLGYPGAGKTTTAKVIADLTGAVHLSSDLRRLELFEQPTFTEEEHQTLYADLDRQTRELLAAGKNVIYDANLNRYKHRAEKYAICRETDAKPLLVYVQTPKRLAKKRAAHISRLHLWPKKETPEQMFDRIAEVIEPPHTDEPYITVDGTKVTHEYVKELLREA